MDALLSEMDQMDALLSMITLALLVAPLHAYLTKRDFLDLQGWLINFMIQRQGVQDFKEAWMEDGKQWQTNVGCMYTGPGYL